MLIVTFSLSDRNLTEIRVIDCGNNTSVLISKKDESVLFGTGGKDFLSSYNISYSIENSGNNILALYTTGLSNNSSSSSVKILKSFSPDEIYCDEIPPEIKPLLKNKNTYKFDSDKVFDNFVVSSFTQGNKSFSYIKNEDVSVLLMFDPIVDFESIPDEYADADVIIMRNDYPDGIENSDAVLSVVNSENSRGLIVQNELNRLGLKTVATAGCGDIIIKADDGKISVHRED